MKKIILLTLLLAPFIYAEDFFDEEFEAMSSISTGRDVLKSKSASVVSVLNKKYFKDHGFNTVEEAVGSVPGIYLAKNTLAQSHSYVCRGNTSKYNSEVLFMINNTPIKSLLHGNMSSGTWVNMPINNVEKIEVIRGSGSAVYGADAFSCVINIVTSKNNDIAQLFYGNNNSKGLFIENTFNINDDLIVNVSLLTSETYGLQATADEDLQSHIDKYPSLPEVSLAPNKGNFESASFDYSVNLEYKDLKIRHLTQQRSNIGSGFGLNQTIDYNGEYSNTRHVSLIEYSKNFIDDIQTTFKISNFSFSEEADQFVDLSPAGSVNPETGVVYINGLKGSPEIFETQITYSIDNFIYYFEDHIIRFGIGYNKNQIYKSKDTNNFIDISGPNNVPDGISDDYDFFVYDDTDFIFAPEKKRYNIFTYVQDEIDLDNDTILTLGGRFDSYNDFGEVFNPRASLVLNINEFTTNKFMYGKAFRAPSIGELFSQNNPVALGNSNLEPETIETLEYAISFNNQYDLEILSNVYYYEVTNNIEFLEDNGSIQAQNSGAITGHGLELEMSYIIDDNYKLETQYSFQETYDSKTERILKQYPQHMVTVSLLNKINDDMDFNIDLNYYGEKEFLEINGASSSYKNIEDNFVTNLTFNYNINDKIELNSSIHNLFDERVKDVYVANNPLISDLVFPVSERTFMLTINYNL